MEKLQKFFINTSLVWVFVLIFLTSAVFTKKSKSLITDAVSNLIVTVEHSLHHTLVWQFFSKNHPSHFADYGYSLSYYHTVFLVSLLDVEWNKLNQITNESNQEIN